jgi:hypothetical protein
LIRLLFTAAPDPISKAIRKLTGQSVSHVGIQTGPQTVLSAELGGVVEQTDLQFLAQGRKLIASYEATPEGEPHLLVWRAKAHLGDKYAFGELPGFVWSTLARRWLGKAIKNPLHDPKAVVCSEFVLYLDDETGFVTEFVGLDPETTTPGDLLARLRMGGPTFEARFDSGA